MQPRDLALDNPRVLLIYCVGPREGLKKCPQVRDFLAFLNIRVLTL